MIELKNYLIKDLKGFLDVADSIESVFKFYQIEKDKLRAEVYLRTCLCSWSGKGEAKTIMELAEHGFTEAKILETRKPELLSDIGG